MQEVKLQLPRVVVNETRCKGCGYCAAACKKELIGPDLLKRNNAGYPVAVFKGEEHCSGCALCAVVCPDAALEVS